MKKLIVQLIKFGIVGVIAIIIDVGLLMVLKELFKMNVLIASAVSLSVSVTVYYILSMRFVFESSNNSKLKEFIVFVLLSIGGLLLNQLIMWIGVDLLSAYYLVVKIFALIFVPIYNFITRKIFLEKKQSDVV